jgi:hypothetical protein
MAMTVLLKTQYVIDKVELLAEKRRALVQLTLTLNILGTYSGMDSNLKIVAERDAVQKEIGILESELRS